jgi:hypothetical protein
MSNVFVKPHIRFNKSINNLNKKIYDIISRSDLLKIL